MRMPLGVVRSESVQERVLIIALDYGEVGVSVVGIASLLSQIYGKKYGNGQAWTMVARLCEKGLLSKRDWEGARGYESRVLYRVTDDGVKAIDQARVSAMEQQAVLSRIRGMK